MKKYIAKIPGGGEQTFANGYSSFKARDGQTVMLDESVANKFKGYFFEVKEVVKESFNSEAVTITPEVNDTPEPLNEVPDPVPVEKDLSEDPAPKKGKKKSKSSSK